MKRQLLLVAMIAVTIAASAQNEKKVTITKNSELDYAVAPDGKTKDGLYYLKNLSNKGLWVQGHYKKNERTGTWYFFNEKEALTMRYNYDQKKLLYVDTAALHNVTVHILSDDATVAKQASAPLPLCPVDFYVNLIGNKIVTEYPDPTVAGLTAEITAHVDTKGNATYTVAYLVKKDKKTPEIEIDMPKSFPIEWLPSTYNGKAIASEFVVYAKLTNSDTDTFRRFDWSKE